MKLIPGANVDRYQLRALLGWGGMAEVWEVQDRQTGARLALKVLLDPTREQRARLLREADVQTHLEHPNVLPALHVLEVDEVLGLVMPLVEGPTLSALLRSYRLTEGEAFALLRAICAGVGAAHAAGLVHRDLKPSNVLLDLSSGAVVPRVSDFGLVKSAQLHSSLTGSAGVLGTPSYMSPEQLRQSREVDARADLWSLGVMLYELLTGRLPFPADSLPALLDAHRHPPLLDGVSDPVAGVIQALLQVDLRARLPSCADLLSCLEALASAEEPLRGGAARAALALRRDTSEAERPAAAHNLPAQRDAFVGRRQALEGLRRLLDEQPRLVTVTGAGGVGKTRLVLESGAAVAGRWPGGVWLCELSEARTAAALSAVMAGALGVALPVDLGAALAARGRSLFILDNVEQVAEHAAVTLGRWLDAAPEACFLVTSRQPLGLPAERLLALAPMDAEDAIALFVERLRASQPDYAMTEDRRAEVAVLVAALEGLPLAIELAAMRSRRLSVSRLLARLSRRFDLLRGGARDRPERQRSLYASLAWSWALLSEDERSLLALCGDIDGDFGPEDLPGAPTALLSGLADKHLLQRVEGAGAPRYAASVSVRQFARLQR